MDMNKPYYDLKEVQRLVDERKVRWSASKAIDPLKEVYDSNWKPKGYRILKMLSETAFAKTLDQKGMKFDEYALRYDDIGWYVKVSIEDFLDDEGEASERVFTISCHPLEKTMQTNGGEVQP
jgi:hypothetical protein